MNDKIATSSSQSQQPAAPRMQMCTAFSEDGKSQLSWGFVPSAGSRTFDLYARVNQAYVDRLSETGDDALWDAGLKTLLLRDGSRLVGVRLKVARPSLNRGVTRQEYLQETSRALALRAMERLK